LICIVFPVTRSARGFNEFLSRLEASRGREASSSPYHHSYYGELFSHEAPRDGTPSCSLLINTHNRPDALERVFKSVSAQTRLPDEVIIADDGSGPTTQAVIQRWAARQPFPVVHAWRRHEGFHRTRIINRAIALTTAEYSILTDQDMVLHPRFVADHLRLAKPGRFVQGRRILTRNERAGNEFGARSYAEDLWREIWRGGLNRRLGALRWPFPLVYYSRDYIHAVRACNFGVWTRDLVRAGGYDERFVGWGRADSELVLNLFQAGVRRLNEKGWAQAVHLWHRPFPQEHLAANDALLEAAEKGVNREGRLGLERHRPTVPPTEHP
jgi:glycosyltransferase involved in cell wall biosynthesis